MRYLLFCCILLISLPTSGQRSSKGEGWKWFTSVDGLFKVKVPGGMTEKVDTVSTSIGTLEYHTFFYQDQKEGAENFVYMVSYVDYPENTVHSDSTDLLQEFFFSTMKEAEFSVNGEVIYQHPVKIKDYPGYKWRINYKEDQGVIKTIALVKENRYYAVQAVTIKQLALNRSIDLFLDSFTFL